MRTKAEAQIILARLPLRLPVAVLDPGDPDPVDQPPVTPELRPEPGRRVYRYVTPHDDPKVEGVITTIGISDTPDLRELETLVDNLPLAGNEKAAALAAMLPRDAVPEEGASTTTRVAAISAAVASVGYAAYEAGSLLGFW